MLNITKLNPPLLTERMNCRFEVVDCLGQFFVRKSVSEPRCRAIAFS